MMALRYLVMLAVLIYHVTATAAVLLVGRDLITFSFAASVTIAQPSQIASNAVLLTIIFVQYVVEDILSALLDVMHAQINASPVPVLASVLAV
jgi:hypothetical protein